MIEPIKPIREISQVSRNSIIKTGIYPVENNFYTVKPGDSIYSIAKKAYGESEKYNFLLESNKFLKSKNLDVLKDGIVIFIPPIQNEDTKNSEHNTINTVDMYITNDESQAMMKRGIVPIDTLTLSAKAQGLLSFSKDSEVLGKLEINSKKAEVNNISLSETGSEPIADISYSRVKEKFEAFGKFSAGIALTTMATGQELKSAIKEETEKLKTNEKTNPKVVTLAETAGNITSIGTELGIIAGIQAIKGIKNLAKISKELKFFFTISII